MSDTSRGGAYTNHVLLLIFPVAVFNVCDRTIVSVMADDIGRDLALDDRHSRPRIVAAALCVRSLMTALSGAAQNFVQLVLVRMGVGLGEAGGSPPSHSLMADYVPPSARSLNANPPR